MRGLFLFAAGTALLLALAAPGGAQRSMIAQDQASIASAEGFELRPGVIVAPSAGVVYLMKPNRGIECVEIQSGSVRWSSDAGSKPLAIANNFLIAQSEPAGAADLPLAVLNSSDGSLIRNVAVRLPAGTSGFIDQGMGMDFASRAAVAGDSAFIKWSFSRVVISGIARPGPPAGSSAEGVERIDFRSWRVEAVKPEQIPSNAKQFFDAKQPPFTPPPGFTTGFVSADRTNIAAWKTISPDPLHPAYRWSIHSIGGGTKAVELTVPIASSPFELWHTILLYETPPGGRRVNGEWHMESVAIHGLDIDSGREIWSRTIRDTAFRGQLPPHP